MVCAREATNCNFFRLRRFYSRLQNRKCNWRLYTDRSSRRSGARLADILKRHLVSTRRKNKLAHAPTVAIVVLIGAACARRNGAIFERRLRHHAPRPTRRGAVSRAGRRIAAAIVRPAALCGAKIAVGGESTIVPMQTGRAFKSQLARQVAGSSTLTRNRRVRVAVVKAAARNATTRSIDLAERRDLLDRRTIDRNELAPFCVDREAAASRIVEFQAADEHRVAPTPLATNANRRDE